MSTWLFNGYMDEVMEVKTRIVMRGVRFLEERREWRLHGLLYADDLVLLGELEENLRAMVRHFFEVCKRRGLKPNAGKSKVVVIGGEEGLECVICVD